MKSKLAFQEFRDPNAVRALSGSVRNPLFRVSWSRAWLIAFVLALPSQATALQQEGPPVISPSSQVEIQRWVNVEAVNFRNGPGVSYSVIQVLTANNPVQVLGRSGRWVQVEWVSGKDDAIQGWIFGRFLSDNPLTQKELESLKSANSATEVGVSKQKRVYMWALALLAIAVIYLLFKGLFKKRPWGTITGRAYVTDGDGIRVSGYNIRLAGLDAPEWDQFAKHQHGYWFNHGKRVKSSLIRAIGGKHVRVTVEGYDKYGRVLGSVTCNGKDVGARLVRNGHAISAYGDKYKHIEREARKARRGMWGHAEAYDPRTWRHRNATKS